MLLSARKAYDTRKECRAIIDNCKDHCGKLIIAEIIYSVIQTATRSRAVAEIKTQLQKTSDAPLLEFIQDGKKMQMHLKLMRTVVAGEYMNIPDFEHRYGISDELEKMIELVQSFILDNVQSMFRSLKKNEQINYPQFARVMQSPRIRGLYSYDTFGDRSFGIVFIEIA